MKKTTWLVTYWLQPFSLLCAELLQSIKKCFVHRSLRKWWVALPANRQELFRQWAWQRRWNLGACVAVAMVIISLFLLTHLDETPVTGRTRLLVFSRESYMELAEITSALVRDGRGREGTVCLTVCVCACDRRTWSFVTRSLLEKYGVI